MSKRVHYTFKNREAEQAFRELTNNPNEEPIPWFAGLTCDHLYADCPNRKRGEAELRRWCWWFVQGVGIDPEGDLVCGMCRHRYRRKANA